MIVECATNPLGSMGYAGGISGGWSRAWKNISTSSGISAATTGCPTPSRKVRVLIVDDDESIALLIRL